MWEGYEVPAEPAEQQAEQDQDQAEPQTVDDDDDDSDDDENCADSHSCSPLYLEAPLAVPTSGCAGSARAAV